MKKKTEKCKTSKRRTAALTRNIEHLKKNDKKLFSCRVALSKLNLETKKRTNVPKAQNRKY